MMPRDTLKKFILWVEGARRDAVARTIGMLS
eukprot:SAG22_NODE_14558_length_371_cov_1.139706_1_plen_30_part_01